MSFVGSNILAGASGQGDAGYKIERSLRFNSADSAYLNRTPSSAGNRKTWTYSVWLKRSKLGGYDSILGTSNDNAGLRFDPSTNRLELFEYSGSYVWQLLTDQVFRDVSSWYHIVFALDTTQATAADRAKLYVNGIQVTQFATSNYPAQNYEGPFNNNTAQSIGDDGAGHPSHFDGYLADVHFIDSQALAASDFGEEDDNGVWQPKKYGGTYTVSSSSTSLSQTGWNPSTSASGNHTYIWDGDTNTKAWGHNGGTIGTVTFDPPLTNVTKVECYTQNYNHFLNGSSITTSETVNGGWHTYYDNSSSPITLNSLGNAYSSNTQTVDLHAIRINGSYIIDSQTWTPPSNSGIGVQDAGQNSFHLDFSDNSSDSALGTDSSGNNNTWTVNNLKAVEAFGITSAASITSSQTISFPITYAATVTYEFFVQVTSAVTYTYFAHDVTSQDAWNIGISGSNQLLFGNYNGGWTTFSSVGIGDGNWHFVRVTTTGSSTSLYVDGSLVGTNSSGGSVTSGSQITNKLQSGAFKIAHLRITNGGTPPTTGIPAISSMNQAAGSGGTLAFYDALDDIASSGTKTSDGGNVTITMAAATASVSHDGVDSLIDTPTDVENNSGNNGGNYCTLNPLDSTLGTRLSDGNLQAVGNNNWATGHTRGTFGLTSGKWYWEVTKIAGGAYAQIGFCNKAFDFSTVYGSLPADSWTLAFHNGTEILRPAGGGANYFSGSAMAVGDVLGIALDMDNKTAIFSKNGTAGASISLSSTKTSSTDNIDEIFPLVGVYSLTAAFNGGQRPFAYTPPTGYKSLCTQNLADPTIADGSDYFDAKLYTGTNSAQTITGFQFSPDLVWIKKRSAAASSNLLDTVRGARKHMESNATNAETTESAGVGLTAFNSDGFSLGTDNAGAGQVNSNGGTFVAWAWDAGSSNTSISVGDIRAASTVSSGNAYSVGWAGIGSNTWSNTDSWSGLSAVSNNGKGYFSGTENLSDGSQISVANGSFSAGSSGSNGWVLRASSTVTIDFTIYPNITEIATTSSDSQTFADRTIVATNPTTGSSVVATGKCFWFKNASQMSVSHINIVNDAPASPSIASTVRANPSAGFSIVTFTGNNTNSSVGHALNATPGLVIVKSRSATSLTGWMVKHSSLSSNYNLALNLSDAAWNPTTNGWIGDLTSSSTFSLVNGSSDGNNVNENNVTYVAYCFAPIAGYSAFGSYEGNGSTDGPFVFTNFRPAFLLIKRTDAASSWYIFDSARSTFNVVDDRLKAHSANAEDTNVAWNNDFLSNGFKLRTTEIELNNNGSSYIYACFSEHPFKTARAR